jgi:hypothetical protein
MTSPGRYAPLLGGLPRDIPGLAAVAQGLLIHEHIAPAYGVTLSDEERSSVHVRPVERLLELIVARDGRPLGIARAPEARLPVNCRHFTVLMVAMLRAQGTPARARCGFGGYFTDGFSGVPGSPDRGGASLRARPSVWWCPRCCYWNSVVPTTPITRPALTSESPLP